MTLMDFLAQNKMGVLLTLVLLVAGLGAYFNQYGFDPKAGGMGGSTADGLGGEKLGVFEGLRLKVLWSEEGEPEMIALARSNAMAKFKALEGEPIPESGGMVLGYDEGIAMRKAGEFSKVGDRIDEFVEGGVRLGGILPKTGTFVDMFHLLDARSFEAAEGEEGRAFVKLKDGKEPKLFYRMGMNEMLNSSLGFAEGNATDYDVHVLSGDRYYPLVIGSLEAKMMRDEKLFAKRGDTLRGFFGRDVFIAGILAPANNSLDMMHFVPLGESELN